MSTRSKWIAIGAFVTTAAVLGCAALLFTLPMGAPDDGVNRPGAGESIGELINGPQSRATVVSYFQYGVTPIDTAAAVGFVVIPRRAVTPEEEKVHLQFCAILLARLDYLSPNEAAVALNTLVTYWPLVSQVGRTEVEAAFKRGDCAQLMTWYDYRLARQLARIAGVGDLGGPLLITWPSLGDLGEGARYPLIVDFSRADYTNAMTVLRYWLGQVSRRPELWTNRIREGTIRAELADAINNVAGVIIAVFYGKWDKAGGFRESASARLEASGAP